MARILRYRALKTDEGRTAGEVIRREFALVAHDMARAKYRTEKGITVNGEQVMVNRKLHEGDELAVCLACELPGKIVPVKGPLEILYEDEDVIALNKPAGLVVHPSHGHFADTMANFLAQYYLDSGEPHEVRTVGRLDKDTSGVILFGKNRTACAHLTAQASRGELVKTYLAVAEGTFAEESGCVEAPISREYEEKIRRVVREDGDYALTHYRVLKALDGRTLLSLRIDTGRTHQIRVHMAHIGHPLCGDPIYGTPSDIFERAALHAGRITFRQPYSHEEIVVESPLPPDFVRFLGEDSLDIAMAWC